VARILIYEPHGDIEALLRVFIQRLGHETVHYAGDAVDDVDAAVIEPGDGDGLRLARRLRARQVPLLFTSIYPPATEALALEPVAYLVKPFPLSAIERALDVALGAHVAG
jgi:CheY-like chemotaxis protein